MKRLLTALILVLLTVSGVAAQLAIAPDGALLPNGAVGFVVPVEVPLLPAPVTYYSWGPATPLYPVIWPNVVIGVSTDTTTTTKRTKVSHDMRPIPGPTNSWNQEIQSARTDTAGH